MDKLTFQLHIIDPTNESPEYPIDLIANVHVYSCVWTPQDINVLNNDVILVPMYQLTDQEVQLAQQELTNYVMSHYKKYRDGILVKSVDDQRYGLVVCICYGEIDHE